MKQLTPLQKYGLELGNRDGWNCQYCGAVLIPISTSLEDKRYFDPRSQSELTLKGYLSIRLVFSPKKGYQVPCTSFKIPRSKGGKPELDNLVLACHYCTSRKGSKSHEEYLKQLKKERTK